MWCVRTSRAQSAQFASQLCNCGVPAKHMKYPTLSHADFVTHWHPLPEGSAVYSSACDDERVRRQYEVLSLTPPPGQRGATQPAQHARVAELPGFAKDLVMLLSGGSTTACSD